MGRPTRPPTQDRYSVTLLFQYRVVDREKDDPIRTCEKRMLVLMAASARQALQAARRRGRDAEYEFENSPGDRVRFEFIGILDLLQLGEECEQDEVWYDIVRLKAPMERRDRLVPTEAELQAIAADRRRRGHRRR